MLQRLACLAAVTTLVSCLEARPTPPQPECQVSSDCAAGKVCGPSATCIDACKADTDCAAPATCASGACVLPEGRCARDTDCAQGQRCGAGSLCVTPCTSATQCAANQSCVAGACATVATACKLNSDCPTDQACVQGACAWACAADRDCTGGLACTNHFCVPRTVACYAPADCQGGLTCSPTGTCVKVCTLTSDCAATGEACSNGACVTVGSATATLSGAVTLTGVSDASGLTVSLTGPGRATATTSATGAFSFAGLTPGFYVVSVSAPQTVEGHASVELAARAGTTTQAPTFTLTPAGSVTGTVTASGRATHEGVQVVALGTSHGALTAADGGFSMPGLPVGTYDLLATLPGYQSAHLAQAVVSYGQVTALPPVQLQEVISGSSFAFTSAPVTTARVGQPYSYQAQAGGGGVASATYSLAGGPTGMTVNPTTGQVSWTPGPAFASLDPVFVALSANGGGLRVYQVFTLTLSAAATRLHADPVYRIEPVDGGLFTVGNNEVLFTSTSGAVLDAGVLGTRSGPISTIEQLNGQAVSSVTWPGGRVSALRAPSGRMTATWPGGVVGSVSAIDARTVASATLLGGTVTAGLVPGSDVVSSVAPFQFPVTAYSDGRQVPTAVSVPGGLIASLTATTLTDSAANFPATLPNTCLIDESGYVEVAILSATPTTLNLGDDPRLWFMPGQRYFLGQCAGFGATHVTTYTVTQAGAAFTSGTTSWADLYTNDAFITATQVSFTSTTTFTAQSFVSNYSAMLSLPGGGGFYALGNNQGTPATVTSLGATFSGMTSGNTRLTFDDTAMSSFTFISGTATTLTYRAPLGSLLARRLGHTVIPLDPNDGFLLTVGLTTGGLTPDAEVGRYLWLDAAGTSYEITTNAAATVTMRLHRTSLPAPLQNVLGTLVGLGDYSSWRPPLGFQTAGLTPGAYAGRQLYLLTGNSGPPLIPFLPIAASDATSVRFAESQCGGQCINQLSWWLTAFNGRRWAPGSKNRAAVDFRVTLSGGAAMATDSLRGRTVLVNGTSGHWGTALGNDATSVVVEVPEDAFADFSSLAAGDTVWLSGPSTNGQQTTVPLRLSVAGTPWTAGAQVGATLVSSTGVVAGTVTANTANTLDFQVADPTALLGLGAGASFGLARVQGASFGCNAAGASVRADVTLAGATLAPNSYNQLRVGSTATPVLVQANTATSATVLICPSEFPEFLSAQGRPASLNTSGVFSYSVDDAAANYAPNELVGRKLSFVELNFATDGDSLITGNTAHTITVASQDANSWHYSEAALVAAPNANYLVMNDNQEVRLTVTTASALAPGAYEHRFVELSNRTPGNGGNYDLVRAWVSHSSATALTLEGVASYQLIDLVTRGATHFTQVTTSAGMVVRVTDSTASWTPDALAGATLMLNGWPLQVVANTATQLTATNEESAAYADLAAATRWSIEEGTYVHASAVLGQDLLVATAPDGLGSPVMRVTRAGAVTRSTPLSTGHRLSLTAMPIAAGTLTTIPLPTASNSTRWTEPGWAWTPGALVGSYLRVLSGWAGSFSQFTTARIVANTATSITATAPMSNSTSQPGAVYQVITPTFGVTGATLTPGTLKGRLLAVNGRRYVIRDNTASSITVYLSDDLSYGDPFFMQPSEATAIGVVLDGLPGSVLTGLAADGASGYWVSAEDELVHFDGTAWTHLGAAELSPRLGQGTITESPDRYTTFVDSNATWQPGALVGKLFVSAGRSAPIKGNTSTTITIDERWALHGPLVGEAYEVHEPLNFGGFGGLASVGTTLYAASYSGGLLKRTGTTNTWLTVASTESAPGRADGLPFDALTGVRAAPNGDVFALLGSSGTARLSGSSWSSFSVANTESAPGAGDGLVSNEVFDATRDSTGALWFSTNQGVSRRAGTTWTQFGPPQGLAGPIWQTWLSPQAEVYLGSDLGLYRLSP